MNQTATEPVESVGNQGMKWYVVHTFSGFEEKAKSALLERIRLKSAESLFGDIFIPTSVSESVTKTGKKKQITKTQFPGYMLVQMQLDDNTIQIVKETPRITGFIGDQRRPRPLSDSEVLKLTSPDAALAAARKMVSPEILFEKGEGVKVIDGPFSNFDGVVDEVKPDKARLRVLVSIFGRETPVELEYRQVQKLN
jgi:transcriptional antiterminator NusG